MDIHYQAPVEYYTRLFAYQILVLHLVVEWQAQFLENTGHHARAQCLMPVEGPAMLRVEAFSGRLGDIVEDSRPPQPEFVGLDTEVVQDLKGMVNIVFMGFAVADFHTLQSCHFGEEFLKQTGVKEVLKADGRLVCNVSCL